MTFYKFVPSTHVRIMALLAGVWALAACATEDVDDTTGSRLEQSPAGTVAEPPIEAGDIAIAGQDVSHAIRQLPEIADASVPPLVQFKGVTSIVKGPNGELAAVDTEPYTTLLRDRLLLGDREKLRFVERQLPPLTTTHKSHKHEEETTGALDTGSPDYQVLAELRGKVDADFYRIQIEFVNLHSGQVLFNGVYRIRKESASSVDDSSQMSSEGSPPPGPPPTEGSPQAQQTAPPPPEQVTPPPGGWQDGSATGVAPVPPVFHE